MNETGEGVTHRTIERVARESYGRLVAYLCVHTRDLAGAEDALSEALVKALTTWPRDGVPQNPEAWLLTTARYFLIDAVRHQCVVSESEPTLQLLKGETKEPTFSTEFPDERLKLLFVCAHPAIDPAAPGPDRQSGADAAAVLRAQLGRGDLPRRTRRPGAGRRGDLHADPAPAARLDRLRAASGPGDDRRGGLACFGSVGPGGCFGERALLRDVPRMASVVAESDMELLALSRRDFLAAVTSSEAPASPGPTRRPAAPALPDSRRDRMVLLGGAKALGQVVKSARQAAKAGTSESARALAQAMEEWGTAE